MTVRARDDGRPAHVHSFDPVSGWCSGCVGYRDDGRLAHKGGSILRPGTAGQAADPQSEASGKG